MRYLVTGGRGFVGTRLAGALAARGDAVVVLDDLSAHQPAEPPGPLPEPVRFVHGSVLDASLLDELVADCDVVVHLAAAVGVRTIVDRVLPSLTVNLHGAENVMGAAERHAAKVLLASTSEIYGKSQDLPLREDVDRVLGSPRVPRWSYGMAKSIMELIADTYHREHGVQTVVVRLFNTAGPGQSATHGMVIPRMVRQALRGEPLSVYGDGGQTRCFLHVDDAVRALLALLDEERAVGATVNLGSTDEVRVLDLAQRVKELTGSASEIRFSSFEEVYGPNFEESYRRVPDVSRITALTGWRPLRGLDDILLDVIAEVRREALRAGGSIG
ncbi:nucleoside-diphosphate sugar epimerase [Streptomyces sp. CB01201]|nr:nucleoside-diphosphate sugar epimerase [Streptomyces sp. CB01201]